MDLHKPYDRPTDDALKSLITWNEGTKGFYLELQLLKALRNFCDEYGYGRVPQLAESIKDIWNHPERVEHYLKVQKEHRDLMESYRKEIEGE